MALGDQMWSSLEKYYAKMIKDRSLFLLTLFPLVIKKRKIENYHEYDYWCRVVLTHPIGFGVSQISYIGSQKCQNVVWVSKIPSLMWGAENVKKLWGMENFKMLCGGLKIPKCCMKG